MMWRATFLPAWMPVSAAPPLPPPSPLALVVCLRAPPRHELEVGPCDQPDIHLPLSLGAAPDLGEHDLIARRHEAGSAEHAAGHDCQCRGRAKTFNERPAVDGGHESRSKARGYFAAKQ